MRKGEAAVDAWSWVHLASGVALGAVGFGFLATFGLLVLYEAVEALLRKGRSGVGVFEYESWTNILVDILVGMLGLAAAWAVRAAFNVHAFTW